MSPPRLELELAVEDGLPDLALDQARISELVRFIIDRELPPGDYQLGLHLVSDETIRRLNAEHRGKDTSTDVLSFPLVGEERFVLPPGEPVALGDVVVSLERAVAQAHEFGHSTERELGYLVAHGVLHILGYDHEQPDEQTVMRQREEAALEPLGYTRPA
jgi:probable rRNA maturation factor